jgi:hypothetical protein
MKNNTWSSDGWEWRIGFVCGCIALALSDATVSLGQDAQPLTYVSHAKLVSRPRPMAEKTRPEDYAAYLKDFFGSIEEELESAVMNQRATERVAALSLELQPTKITIEVRRDQNSFISDVKAAGAEPRYAKIFLDALMDEYMLFRENLAALVHQVATKAHAADVKARTEELIKAKAKLTAFDQRHSVPALEKGRDDMGKSLVWMNGEKLRLEMEMAKTKALTKARVSEAEESISELNKEIAATKKMKAEADVLLTERRQLQGVVEVKAKALQAIRQSEHRLQEIRQATKNEVMILERASAPLPEGFAP